MLFSTEKPAIVYRKTRCTPETWFQILQEHNVVGTKRLIYIFINVLASLQLAKTDEMTRVNMERWKCACLMLHLARFNGNFDS